MAIDSKETQERRLRLHYRYQPTKRLLEFYHELGETDRRMIREALFERGHLHRLWSHEQLRSLGI